jgi:hypothetical protein
MSNKLEKAWITFFRVFNVPITYKPFLGCYLLKGYSKHVLILIRDYDQDTPQLWNEDVNKLLTKVETKYSDKNCPDILLLGNSLIETDMGIGPGYLIDGEYYEDPKEAQDEIQDYQTCDEPEMPEEQAYEKAFFLYYLTKKNNKEVYQLGFGSEYMSYIDRIGSNRHSSGDLDHGAWKYNEADGVPWAEMFDECKRGHGIGRKRRRVQHH